MRSKPYFWAAVSLLLFVAAIGSWQYGNRIAARRAAESQKASGEKPLSAVHPPLIPASTKAVAKRKSYRITNTRQSLAQLIHNRHALILRNALIDTLVPVALKIPDQLKAKGAPGSYLVQADRPLDNKFRAELRQAGAIYISYVPNNAALVQATPEQATNLSRKADVVAVLPYEPYYKLDSTLLPSAVDQPPQPDTNALDLIVTTFPGQRDAALTELKGLGAGLIGEDKGPFGPSLVVHVPAANLVALARLPLAQEIESFTPRHLANDLTRVLMSESTNTLRGTPTYLNLSGSNVTVNINDTGVDSTHPDFAPTSRLLADFPSSLVDGDGHGTHVAGIIAGNGFESKNVPNPKAQTTNVPGSVIPGADFRGKATNATLFVQGLDLVFGPFISDSFLQQNASANLGPTNLISNNSWDYGAQSYDMHAASYDAATRDAQPGVDGEQPLLFVFAAGNSGNGSDNGLDGTAGSINSPATAKNVITVGCSDSPRHITNLVSLNGQTNAVWLGQTGSSNLVSWFSSCGNVDAGVEGTYGRFKPDVVAPGAFTISCRSSTYVDPTNVTTVNYNFVGGQVVAPGKTNDNYTVFIPPGTSAVVVTVTSNAASPSPFPNNMLILADKVSPPTTVVSSNDVYVLTNFAYFDIWTFGVAPPTNSPGPVDYDLNIYELETNSEGNYFQVLSNLNNVLKPWYRYESGTSMSAGAVSGTLALMQEFLQGRMSITNPSPALLKAMLINGSRSLNNLYDYNVNTPIANEQGWGMPNLPSCIPASLTNKTAPSMVLVDQSPSNALATGQYQTYSINCADANAANFPIRMSLVWTDPPGDPAAGIALVNNLDLTVVDSTGSNIYIGNNFRSGDIFTEASSPTNLPAGTDDNSTENIFVNSGGTAVVTAAGDSINNVQNVYISPLNGPIAFPLTITVSGTRVNVNAVTTQTNNISQDYALVISSDDTTLKSPLTITTNGIVNTSPVLITIASNGVPLLHERVGANDPGLYNHALNQTNGDRSQWHFFIFTNDQFSATNQATNVAFATFLPPNLSIPRASGGADIDMYVSTNSNLLNLTPHAVLIADKSVGRSGTESIIYTNSTKGEVYYIGVKSEDQQAADFGFYGIAQELPFSSGNANNNGITATGTSLPVFIPNALSPAPALVFAFMLNPNPVLQKIRRVTVNLGINHPSPSDLTGSMQHNGITAVLNHNTGNTGGFTNTYDDYQEDPNTTVTTDPPGNLTEFVNEQPDGLWLLTETDDAPTQNGYVTQYSVSVDLQQPSSGFFATIPPKTWFDDYVLVPNDATNMIIYTLYENNGTNLAGTGPIGIYLTNNVGVITTTDYGSNNISPPGGSLTLGTNNPPPGWPAGTPPLAGGTWYYGIYNSGSQPVSLFVVIDIQQSLTPNVVQTFTNNTLVPLTTDAHTQSQICINSMQQLVDLQVGLVLSDTNTDDLSIHLISPEGTSVLLFENRGGQFANGLGLQVVTTTGTTNLATNYVYTVFTEDTNLATTPIKFAPPPYASVNITPAAVLWSNSFETVTNGIYTNGAVLEGWHVTNNVVNITATNSPAYLTNDEVGIVTDPTGDTAGTNSLGSNYLALTSARIIQTFGATNKIPITNGQPYELVFYAKPSGIIDWWPADNNTYDIIDTNDGSLNNGADFASGEVGEAFLFGGPSSAQYFAVPDNTSYHVSSLTSEQWVNFQSYPLGVTGPAALSTIMAKPFRSAFDSFNLWTSNGVLNGEIATLGPTQQPPVSFPWTPALNTWHHVAYTFDNATALQTLYVDGLAVATNTVAGPIAYDTTHPLQLGANIVSGARTAFLNGRIDEASLYNRALSPAEIFAIYHAGSLGKYSTNSLLPNFQLTIDGVTTNTAIFTNASSDWQLFTNSFVATNNQITVEFSGNSMGVLLDDIELIQLANTNYNNYYLPEEPMTPFIGENPLGCWTLDIWDTRSNSTAPFDGSLLSWTLQVTTSSTNATLTVVTNGKTITNTVPPGSIDYFAIDVPPYALFATNTFTVVGGASPLTLLFDQSALPTGNLPGDIVLQAGVTAPNQTVNVFSTLGAPPPLLPGQRYFLGVYNPNPGAGQFTLTVQFNGYTNTIIPLTNAIPYSTNIGTNTFGPNGPDYYSFVVPTNTVMATFQIYNVAGGEVDLYASASLPLPGPFDFDYASANSGASDQVIVVTTNSVPVPLAPASTNNITILKPTTWYLTAYNSSGIPGVTYNIVASVVTNGQLNIIPLTNNSPYASTNISPPDYPTNVIYSFAVSNSPPGIVFTVANNSGFGNVQLLAQIDGFPTPQDSFAASYNPGTGPQFIQIVPSASLPSLNGVWYLVVPSTLPGNVSYTVTAYTNSIVPPPVVPLIWSGVVDDYWDILVTSNWVVTGSLPPQPYPYQDGSQVTFDDTAMDSTVYVSTAVSPASMTLNNNTLSYQFLGPGSINGATGLNMTGAGYAQFTESGGDSFGGGITMSGSGTLLYGASGVNISGTVTAGSGTLILDQLGTINGITRIPGGTLFVGYNDAAGALATGVVRDNGNLVFFQTNSSTVANMITGGGNVFQVGAGVLSLAGNNSFSGNTFVGAGTLIVDNTNALGSWAGGPVTVAGGTLDLGGLTTSNGPGSPLFGAKQFYIGSNGVGGIGAIVNNGTNQQQGGLENIALITNASIGGATRWDMRNPGGTNTLTLNSNTLTKTGSNQISLVATVVTPGSIVITQGLLSVELTPTFTIPSNTSITVITNGLLGQNSNTLGSITCPITLNGGGITNLTGSNITYLDAPIFISNNSTIGNGGGTDLFNGIISGPGGLTNSGPGTTMFSATNTYAGPTYIAQGTLALTNTGSISNSVLITVTTNATLDSTQSTNQTLTLASNQTLQLYGTYLGAKLEASAGSAVSGNGLVNSNLTIDAGASLSLSAGTNPLTLGTLTVVGNAVLNGTTSMKINPNLSPAQSNDVLAVSNVVYGGTLNVTNLGSPFGFSVGDSFTLFNVTNSSGAFTLENLPPLAGGLVWSTTFGANGPGSIIVATNQVPIITQFIVNAGPSNAVFSGSNGVPGGQYVVLTSTNLLLPLTNWAPVLTDYFNSLGDFVFTNALTTNGQQFYILQSP